MRNNHLHQHAIRAAGRGWDREVLYVGRNHSSWEQRARNHLGRARVRWEGGGVPALILIIQQHTPDNAAQMPALQTQVLSRLALIAANWCSDTSSICVLW